MFKRILTLFLLPALLLAQAPKVSVTTRQSTGAPLTFTQADKNFTDLQAAANASQRAWGQKESATTGLVFGYYGGPSFNGTTWTSVGDGTVTLAASQTNYVERTAAGVVSANTTGWSSGKVPLAMVVTGPTSITTINDFRSGTVADASTFKHSLSGSVRRTLQEKLDEWPSFKDFGAKGDGTTDDTAAIQAAVNTLVAGTTNGSAATGNGRLFLPKGTYKITSTITLPNSASNFMIKGEGPRASMIVWGGSSGVPMIKCVNARQVVFEGLGVIGNTSAPPSACIQMHRDLAWTGPGAPTEACFNRMDFGGDGGGMATTGVLYSAESITYDSNNDRGFFTQCNFNNLLQDGVWFSHGNSLVHILVNCGFVNCGRSAINTVHSVGTFDASFIAFGGASSGNATTWRLGGTTHAITITGWQAEGDIDILDMPASATSPTLNLTFNGCSWAGAAGTADLKFDAGLYSSLSIFGGRWTSGTGIALNFPTTGSTVMVDNCYFNYTSLSYNNNVLFTNAVTGVTNPTFTNLGSGWVRAPEETIYIGGNTYQPTLSNSVAETTILAGGGSLGNSINRQLPANAFHNGTAYRIKMNGYVADTGTPTLQIRVKGSATVWDTGAVTLPTLTGNQHWEAEWIIVGKTEGAAGTVKCSGHFRINNTNTLFVMAPAPSGADTTINTTGAFVFDVTAQWGTASPSNLIVTQNCTIEKIQGGRF